MEGMFQNIYMCQYPHNGCRMTLYSVMENGGIFLNMMFLYSINILNLYAKYFGKLSNLQISEQILQWTRENAELLEDSLFKSPLNPLIELFLRLFPEKSNIEENAFKAILQGWISGKLYIEIICKIFRKAI